MRYIRVLFFIFALTGNVLFSATYGPQSMFTTETSGIKRSQKKKYSQNNFSTFGGLGGRSALGINFATVFYGLATKPLFKFIGDIIEPYPDKIGIAVPDRAPAEVGNAFSIYFDFAITDYFTVGTEIGASELVGDFIVVNTIVRTFLWSVNAKFFPAGNAPIGFYLQPKFGGTHLTFDGQYFNNTKFLLNSVGFYASIEIGWRIVLYPRRLEELRNRITLDISVIDIGYYFLPWNKEIYSVIDSFSIVELDKYRKASSMRILPFPKIGISFTF